MEGFKQMVAGLLAAFPDLHFTIEDQIVADDKVSTRWTAEGTNTGTFGEVPPTGRRVHVDGLILDRVENGKVVERLTALVQHFVPALWLPLAALEILAFVILFIAAALLRPDEDVLLAGFLVSFAVGIAILVSKATVGIVVHRSIGAVALSAPALAVGLLLRGIIFVPLMALLIWIARRVQRAVRPHPAKVPVGRRPPPAATDARR